MDMEKLKVYYGWAKINAVRKKRPLSVMFENDLSCRRDRGQRVLSATQDTVFVRYQDEEEMTDAKAQNRIFTGYDLFLDEKPFNGSLELLLESNSEADKNHVSKNMRERITEALRKAFMLANPDYREPGGQLSLKFGE